MPSMALTATVVWLLCGLIPNELWMQFGCFVVATYLMVELNNSNALLRIYSRMVSCSFIMLMCSACFLFQSLHAMVTALCMAASVTCMFHTYQDRLSMGWTFYAYMCIGICSVLNVHILYMLPIMWLSQLAYMRSLTIRTFLASMLGVICPYWFLMVYLIFNDQLEAFETHFGPLLHFGPIADFSDISVHTMVSLAFVVITAAIGITHYQRKRQNDKIRTRMCYDTFIIQDLTALVLLTLQPQHSELLLTLMILSTSPLVAHYISLTHTRLTDITFRVMTLVAVSLSIMNIMQLT